MFWIQIALLLVCILLGSRRGGMGLGAFGGIGLLIMAFGFGAQPASPPISVMLMILAVVTAASALQAAGGLQHDPALAADALVVLTEWNVFRGLDLGRLRTEMRTPLLNASSKTLMNDRYATNAAGSSPAFSYSEHFRPSPNSRLPSVYFQPQWWKTLSRRDMPPEPWNRICKV